MSQVICCHTFQMEREFPHYGSLTVWGREWSGLMLNWDQGDEQIVTIADTHDLILLSACVDLMIGTIDKLESLAPAQEIE